MATLLAKIRQTYPKRVQLGNNTEVSVGFMTEADADRIVAFAKQLPEDDSLFLRMDITRPDVVTRWVQNVVDGQTVTLLAEIKAELVGYVSLHLNEVDWQRHLGEIRLQIGRAYRSQGLGRALAGEIFSIARDLKLRKIIAQMTLDQPGAIATFGRMGFQREALLQDFVLDRTGKTRDVLMMTYDMTGLTDHLD